MVKGVHIENFRSFKELTVENLAPLNIVVGKNNTGKSSFLEAVFLALDATAIVPTSFHSVYKYILEKRGMQVRPFLFFHPMETDQINEIEWINELAELLRVHFFYYTAKKAKIHLELDNRIISHEFEFKMGDLAFLDEFLLNDDKDFQRFELASLMDNGQPVMGLYILLNNKINRIRYSFRISYSRDKQNEGTLRAFLESCIMCKTIQSFVKTIKHLESVNSPEVYESIKEIISPFFSAPVESFSPGMVDFYVNLSDGTRIPLSMVGDGIRSFILHYMALGISLKRKAYLFFEEPENYLHPGLMSVLARAMVETPHQVFAATHNLDFLKRTLYYAKEHGKDIRVLAFRDLKDGIPEIKIYDLEEAFTALNVLEMDLR